MSSTVKSFAIAFVMIAAAPSATALAQAETAPISAQEMVAASDRVRNPGQPFRLTSTLVEYVGGKARDSVVLTVYARESADTHQYRNLVRYRDPPRDAGKMVLLNGANLWFYDPASKASIRISPQQRLIGQASDGDVVTVNLARDYTAKIVGAETLQDADRQQRDCWHLDLAAATPEAIYSRVEYWLEKGTYRPVKGRFYADSGRVLKIAYFHRYADVLGAPRPTETIIIDAVDSNLVTTLTSSDYRAQAIPDSWFQRDFLPRLPPE